MTFLGVEPLGVGTKIGEHAATMTYEPRDYSCVQMLSAAE